MIEPNKISYADQQCVDAFKIRLGANPKTLEQLREEEDWYHLIDNITKLRHAIRCREAGILVLTNGAKL